MELVLGLIFGDYRKRKLSYSFFFSLRNKNNALKSTHTGEEWCAFSPRAQEAEAGRSVDL